MRIHRWLDFKITRRCNNAHRKCEYCDVPVVTPDRPELLALDVIHRTLLDARSLGFDRFHFLGGEPMLRLDAHEVFAPLGGETDVSLTVVTNGAIRRWDVVDALYSTHAERACVQFSLDSFAPDTPKRCDPRGVLDTLRRTAERARRASRSGHACEVEVHAVITRHNLQSFDSMARELAHDGIPTSVALVCPWTICDQPSSLREFTSAEVNDIARRIRALRTGLAIDAFNPVVADFIDHLRSGNVTTRACGAGLTHLVVNADGSVHHCMADSFDERTSIGNIVSSRLHAILRSAQDARHCSENPSCFDGFAWDRLALSEEWRCDARS